MNGRVTPEHNNYTFVSTRGSSVPDYIFCPAENLYNCVEMKTILVSDVINQYSLLPPSSIPDHSILSSKFVTSFFDIGKNYENQNENCSSPSKSKKPPRKNLSKINCNFMMSDETLELVLSAIAMLECKVDTKKEIDDTWAKVKEIFMTEMSKLPDIPSSKFKKQNRKFRKSKPFWNDELEILWARSCTAEKEYLKFKVQSNADFRYKNYLRTNFKVAQKVFDKKYRYFKRQHHKKQYDELEINARTDPSAMWAALKKLNNFPDTKAALEIVREDQTISTDVREVLERWFRDISGLFSGLQEDPEVAFDDNFYREVLEKKNEFENLREEHHINEGDYDTSMLNADISYDEELLTGLN